MNIRPSVLRAFAKCRYRKRCRWDMDGVLVRKKSLEATDSHILARISNAREEPIVTEIAVYSVQDDDETDTSDKPRHPLECGVLGEPIPGAKWPNTQGIALPESRPRAVLSISPTLLRKLLAVAEAANADRVSLQVYGDDDPLVVTADLEPGAFTGFLMPFA